MELREIQKLQKNFIYKRKWERFNATQVFSHLIEELGELIQHFLYQEQYKVEGVGHKRMNTNLSQEFAQAFNLFLQLAIAGDVDLEEAWKQEYETNQKTI